MPATIREALYGLRKEYSASNLEEAVEMAQRFKANGDYDWFRGQVRDKPPYSSLHRVQAGDDPDKLLRAKERLTLFVLWAKKTPEVSYMLAPDSVHALFATVQHYGIPTHYVDFTTEPSVAGFFAADTRNPPKEGDGNACIYCLNTAELKETWPYIQGSGKREGVSIEPVTIDVKNLWRLEAQRGVFLFANYNWDIDYPLDRIVFPYSGYPAYPTRDRIYPKDKSPLEQLLDQYFSLENSTFAAEDIIRMFEDLKGKGHQYAGVSVWQQFEGGYYSEAFPQEPTVLSSWESATMAKWLDDPDEPYHETVGVTRRLSLKSQADPAELRKTVSFAFSQLLASEPTIRSKSVEWDFSALPPGVTVEQLNDALRPAWNGMRRLPYDDREIGDALGTIAALLVGGFKPSMSAQEYHAAFTRFLGTECFQVGFHYTDNSDSRGYVTRSVLQAALRSDMSQLLTEKHRDRAGDVEQLFRVIYNPSRMFDFQQFKSAFAREVIPAQVLLGRNPILFNPVKLKAFGLP